MGRRRVTHLTAIRLAACLLTGLKVGDLLAADDTPAAAPPCVRMTLSGVDAAFEEALRAQLRNELGASIENERDPASCYRLRIEIEDKTANISLTGERTFNTTLRLDEVLPAHWSWAIALSSAGLLKLQKDSPVDVAGDAEETLTADSPPQDPSFPSSAPSSLNPPAPVFRRIEPYKEAAAPNPERPAKTPNASDEPKTEVSPDDEENPAEVTPSRPKDNETPEVPSRIRLGVQVGGRVLPTFPVGGGEVTGDVGVRLGAAEVEAALLGMWGGRPVALGKIYTVGVGIRATAWWHVLNRNAFRLRLGPAVEALAVWGYGRAAAGAKESAAVAPVVDLLVLLGGSYPFSAKVSAGLVLGGGWTARHFILQEDGKAVAGLSGGLVTLAIGVDFHL